MDYSNMDIVTNVAIPYTQKVDDTPMEPKQLIQQDLHTTQQTVIQNDKDSSRQVILSDSYQYTNTDYQEIPGRLFL